MIDEALKVWLIEVNTNPAIEECSSVLRMLIPRMLDDMFKLTIDRIFSLKRADDPETYPVKGFSSEENMWELLGDFREGVNEKTMSKRMTLVRR
jgi:tubulin monoglycylase TTLL3/8